MLQRPKDKDSILALKPLLGNTTILPTNKNWKQIRDHSKSDAEFITAYLTDVGGRMAWIKCPECGEEWNNLTMENICVSCSDEKQDALKRQTENGAYLLKTIGAFGIEHYAFHKYAVDRDNQMAFAACESFDPKTQNLYIYGLCGVGKTHLAGAILKQAAAKGNRIKWATPIYLARGLRSGFASNEEAFIDDLVVNDVLVIDDVGVGRDVNTILQATYEILEKRRNRNINGLVLTSNHSLGDLSKKYGDDRLSSRIAGMCRVLAITGEDRRVSRETN